MARVYGLVGWIGCGKDTAAQYLVDRYNYRQVSFANTLKDAVAAVFGWSRELLEGRTMESRVWREQPDSWWSQRLNIPNLTPRWVLQNVGTEVFRNHFHQDIWIASTERVIQSYLDQGYNVVISDCRFANEFASIQQADGCLIRINRDRVIPVWSGCATTQNNASADELAYLQTHNMTMDRLYPTVHASEWNWVGRSVSYVIDNTGTLSELHDHLDQMVFAEFAHSKVAD
jgi:hypothetical protein